MLEMVNVGPLNNLAVCSGLFGCYRMHLYPGKADNDATPARCNGPNPDRGKPLSANVIGLQILQRTV